MGRATDDAATATSKQHAVCDPARSDARGHEERSHPREFILQSIVSVGGRAAAGLPYARRQVTRCYSASRPDGSSDSDPEHPREGAHVAKDDHRGRGGSTRVKGNGARERDSAVATFEDLKRKDFEKEVEKLHVELVKVQQCVQQQGLKVCVVFEGRDGAGKGGAIKAITERVSPRVFRVVALPTPTERERSQMYMQRYVPHLPAAGEIVIFDRSWYNRAGVERVMGFCTKAETKMFLKDAPLLEKMMVDSGILLTKYWLEVSQEEQARRLQDRIEDGRKVWKLSPIDLESYARWDDYSEARDEMFEATDTEWAPWFVAQSDHKRRARLNIISHLLSRIPYKSVERDKVKLPKRRPSKHRRPEYRFKRIPEVY